MSVMPASRTAADPLPQFARHRLRVWPGGRWWIVVLLVLAAHVGLILWLGDRGSVQPRATEPSPTLRLADAPGDELLALTDPTLFALPHRHGFSGAAWIAVPPPELPQFS